jgi:hypothetical protein
MKHSAHLITVMLLMVCSLLEARVVQKPSDPSVYFYHSFEMMTNPDNPVEARLAFEKEYARMNGLKESDIVSLRAREAEFAAAFVQSRADTAAIAATDEDGSATHALNAAFRSKITEIGNRFLAEISPGAAERIRAIMGPLKSPDAGGDGRSQAVETAAPHMKPPMAHTNLYCPDGVTLLSSDPNCLPPSFISCIASGSAKNPVTCTLPAASGTGCTSPCAYYVNGTALYPIVKITSSYVTVEGAAGGGTIIRRMPNASGALTTQLVEVQQGEIEVGFEYLTLDGNSPAVATYCSTHTGSYGCSNSPIPYNDSTPQTINNLEWFDLDLQEFNLAGYPQVQYTTVTNCTFLNQPGIAVYTNYWSNVLANDFYFVSQSSTNGTNSNLTGNTAIWTWNNSSPAAGQPQSTEINFSNNLVIGSGGGGTGINGSANVLIQSNIFFANHQQCGSTSNYPYLKNYGSQLGVVDNLGSDDIATNVEVYSNTVSGTQPSGYYFVTQTFPCTGGTEFWGIEYQINENHIEYNPLGGLITQNASSVVIYDNQILGNGSDGIEMLDPGMPDTSCPPAPVSASPWNGKLFQITDNTIENNGTGTSGGSQKFPLPYGYAIEGIGASSGCAANVIPDSSTVSLSGNTISGNGNGSSSYQSPYYH